MKSNNIILNYVASAIITISLAIVGVCIFTDSNEREKEQNTVELEYHIETIRDNVEKSALLIPTKTTGIGKVKVYEVIAHNDGVQPYSCIARTMWYSIDQSDSVEVYVSISNIRIDNQQISLVIEWDPANEFATRVLNNRSQTVETSAEYESNDDYFNF